MENTDNKRTLGNVMVNMGIEGRDMLRNYKIKVGARNYADAIRRLIEAVEGK